MGLQGADIILPLDDPPQRQMYIKSATEALKSLCGSKCLDCSPEECEAEAEKFAKKYVDMFYAKRTWRFPRGFKKSDYSAGWMCYQWQTHTYKALFDVENSKCFDIMRVGFIEHTPAHTTYEHRCGAASGRYRNVPESFILQHSWVAISASKQGSQIDKAPVGECTVYLDPWPHGKPEVFVYQPGENGQPGDYGFGHPLHNYMVEQTLDTNKPGSHLPSWPNQVHGSYLQPGCEPNYLPFDWSWPWFD